MNILTDKKYRPYLIGTAILIVAGACYYFFKYKPEQEALKKKTPPPEPIKEVDPTTLQQTSAVELFSDCPNEEFPLKYGSCGPKVIQLQTYMLQQYGAFTSQNSEYGVDGKFGTETEKTLLLHLKRDNISQDYWDRANIGSYSTTL